MQHKSIETIVQFHSSRNANITADALWAPEHRGILLLFPAPVIIMEVAFLAPCSLPAGGPHVPYET